MNQLALFDYDQLDQETRIVVRQLDRDLDEVVDDVFQKSVRAGRILSEIRFALRNKRPGFYDYLSSKGIQKDKAYKLIQISENLETYLDSRQVSQKFESFEALSLLAAPSTPDEARQEAIERAQNGESITHSAAKEIVNNHKPASEPGEFPDDRRPYTLFPDGHKEHVTFESIQNTKALLDEKEVNYFTCSVCQDIFDKEVWHCPSCDHHWPIEKEQCSNCWQDREPPDTYNYKRDNRRSVASDIYTPLGMDACQTPPYAVDPLLPYLLEGWNIWEPAAGEGYLVEALYDGGYHVESGDILTGQNFFDYEPDNWDAIVTNPPYSIQAEWLERCYQLGKPFALLLKVEALGTQAVQRLMKQYGFEIMLLDKRVDFKMPFKGWDSSAQFPTFWLCWQMLPKGKQEDTPVVFEKLQKEKMV